MHPYFPNQIIEDVLRQFVYNMGRFGPQCRFQSAPSGQPQNPSCDLGLTLSVCHTHGGRGGPASAPGNGEHGGEAGLQAAM